MDDTVTIQIPGSADWRDQAACAGCDVELWFPASGDMKALKAAKAVCRTCPVKDPCLEYALENRQWFGVWGGLSERQRRHLQRHQIVVGVAPAPTPTTHTDGGEL